MVASLDGTGWEPNGFASLWRRPTRRNHRRGVAFLVECDNRTGIRYNCEHRMIPDRHQYFRSLADELIVQANRVRSLIGERHWVSDGHHKEYLLVSLLQRYLPDGTLIARGFVADLNDAGLCSHEQDILIVDTTFQAPLFYQGDLIIADPSTVLATISVKSTLTAQTIKQTVENQNSVRKVLCRSGRARYPHFSAGYFFTTDAGFEQAPERVYRAFQRACEAHLCPRPVLEKPARNPAGPELICSGKHWAYTACATNCSEEEKSQIEVRGYNCDGLAASVLISGVVEHIAECRGLRTVELPSLIEHPAIKPIATARHAFAVRQS